jgi:hypothetical protein
MKHVQRARIRTIGMGIALILIVAAPSAPPAGAAPHTWSPAGAAAAQVDEQRNMSRRTVSGRRIPYQYIGPRSGPVTVVVGGIQGEQPRTTQLVNNLISTIKRSNQSNARSAFILIPSLNPDGSSRNERCNDNRVDLNRNFDTANWKRNAPPGCGKSFTQTGTGGARPFSEPESLALRDLLSELKRERPKVHLVILHTTVRQNREGSVFPGYTSRGNHPASVQLAGQTARALRYRLTDTFDYTTTGEAISWAAEQGIPAIDILWPAGGSLPNASTLVALLRQAIGG